MLDELAKARLIVVTGKGGVGKSTISAALALASAREGKRTLICEINTDDRLERLLSLGPVAADIRQLSDLLWAVNIRPDIAMREYFDMVLKFDRLSRALTENRLLKYFLRFIPSLQDLVMLGKVLFHAREMDGTGAPRFERVIMDTPSTGHALSLFGVPQVVIDTVGAGALANQATWMRDDLVDASKTSVVLVTLPEETPVNESIEMCAALHDKLKMHPTTVIANRVHEFRFAKRHLATLPASVRPFIEAKKAMAAQSTESVARLAALGLVVRKVPHLTRTPFGRSAVEEVWQALNGDKPPQTRRD